MSTHDDGGRELLHVTEDTFLQTMITSAGYITSLFTSWKYGRHDQFFLNKTALADRATEWLDLTMNTLLNIYGLKKCVRLFGAIAVDMPREETKVCPDSFILDYISTLHIGEHLNRERGVKERAPPDNRVTKRRV